MSKMLKKFTSFVCLSLLLCGLIQANQNAKPTPKIPAKPSTQTAPKQPQKPQNQAQKPTAQKPTQNTAQKPAQNQATTKTPAKAPQKSATNPKPAQTNPTQKAKSKATPKPATKPTQAKSKNKTPAKKSTNTKKAKPKQPVRILPSQSELKDIASRAKIINFGEANSTHLAKLKRGFEGKNELKILVFGDSHIAADTLTHEWRKSIIKPDSIGFIYPVFPTYHQNLLVKTTAKDYEVLNSRIDAYDDYPFGGVIARAKKENANVKITLKFPPEHQDFLFKAIFKAPSKAKDAFIIKDSSGQSIYISAKEPNKWEISKDFALRFPIEITALMANATLGGYFIYQDSKQISDTSLSSKSQLNKLKKLRPNPPQIPHLNQPSTQNDTNNDDEAESSQDFNTDVSQDNPNIANQNLQKFSYAELKNLPKNTNNLIAHIGANGARSDIWQKWNQKALNDTLCAFKYDFIVLVYGSNDALVVPLDTRAFEENYSALITLLRKCNEGASILLVGPPKVITKPRKSKNYRLAPYFDAVRESVKKIAKKEGALYFDMHEFMEDSGGKDAWVAKSLSKKDVHLTPFGYALVANGITYGLGKVLNLSDSTRTKIESKNDLATSTHSAEKSTKDTQETQNIDKTPPQEKQTTHELKTPDISTAPQEIWQNKVE